MVCRAYDLVLRGRVAWAKAQILLSCLFAMGGSSKGSHNGPESHSATFRWDAWT